MVFMSCLLREHFFDTSQFGWVTEFFFSKFCKKSGVGFGLGHSPKAVFWLAQFQLSDFSSNFSELGCSIVLANHNFDTFLLWEIFFQWFWHFRLKKIDIIFSRKKLWFLTGVTLLLFFLPLQGFHPFQL